MKDLELAPAESLYCFHARKSKRRKQHSRSQVGLRAVGDKSCDRSCHGGSRPLPEKESQRVGFKLFLVQITKDPINSGWSHMDIYCLHQNKFTSGRQLKDCHQDLKPFPGFLLHSSVSAFCGFMIVTAWWPDIVAKTLDISCLFRAWG